MTTTDPEVAAIVARVQAQLPKVPQHRLSEASDVGLSFEDIERLHDELVAAHRLADPPSDEERAA